MQRRFCSACLLVLGLLVIALVCEVTLGNNPVHAEQPVAPVQPQELIQPKPLRRAHTAWHYRGKVVAVGVDWVELGAGWQGSIERDETGRETVRMNGDNKKPKRISAAGTKPGGDPKGEGRQETHWVSDLRVGDVVSIETATARDGTEWTTEIWIQRRPGGKIPPMHGELLFPGQEPTNHLQYQAEQDWEEKGIAIPKRFLNKEGRAPWTNPPYPPVAPMPRAAKP